MRVPPDEVLLGLLEAGKLSAAEVEERLARARDPAYWRALAPDLSVLGDHTDSRGDGSDAAVERAIAEARETGVFVLRGAVPADSVRRLDRAVAAARGAGWPAAFAFVYDEPWLAARTPPLETLLTGLLGGGVAQTAHLWAHVVQPIAGGSGWEPHVDGSGAGRVAIWIALTDAPVESACLHLLPRPFAPEHFAERFQSGGAAFTDAEVGRALHGVRAVPARPGDVIGWSFDIVHWGGQVRDGSAERRALAMEFLADGETAADDERPLTPLATLPALEDRLRTIASEILVYRKYDPLLARFAPVARGLIQRADPPR
jgi:hypothetical protein